MSKSEWRKYRCTTPPGGQTSFSYSSLTQVYHIAHVRDAWRIVQDGRIKKNLISEQSRLGSTRTCVSWLSANLWGGSIYGNIAFAYDWKRLVHRRDLYWVEDVPEHKSYRFLISTKDATPTSLITEYDPKRDGGPILLDEGEWHFNGDWTAEFMIEEDLPLSECIEIKFLGHKNGCRLYGSACSDLGLNDILAGARFISHVIGNDLPMGRYFSHDVTRGSEGLHLGNSTAQLFQGLVDKEPSGPVTQPALSRALVRGALLLYAEGDVNEARELLSSLASIKLVKKTLQALIRECLGVPDFELLV